MSLRDWAERGWLRPHATSRDEVAGLLRIVERDIADAGQSISAPKRERGGESLRGLGLSQMQEARV